jgi:hypothetical protein
MVRAGWRSDSSRQRRVSPTRRSEADIANAYGERRKNRQVQQLWKWACAVEAD